MSLSDELIAIGQKLLINLGRAPIVMSRGEGCRLWDSDGRCYLDMTAGIAVCIVGHGDAGLTRAIAEQAGRLHHTSNLYYIEMQVRLAQALAERAFPGKFFFCNSGTEANEAALKLARRYQTVVRGQSERVELIAFDKSFHGRTMGALSVTGQAKYRQGFGPLLADVSFLPFGDLEAARAAIGPRTCAVIAEPIQAEGGINLPPPGYLQELRRLCSERGALLILDEVQTGIGRTGSFYAFEREAMVPDIVTLAKGLAGGVPMGAMVASAEVERAFEPGTHAATFGGNPLSCAAALYIQQAIDERDLLAHCHEMGAYLGAALARMAERRRPKTRGARGRGLLQGLVLEGEAGPVVLRARDRGLLLSSAGGNVVRFAPPLIVGRAEIDEALAILDQALAES
ncbi:MAG: aspartate aminotransferase family protein [Polyangia bacterium]|jgi:predicted acetylornithine/succinylornithine family transaminase